MWPNGQHELKLLNFSVIFYILLGALVFHSLGEFDIEQEPAAQIAANSLDLVGTTTTTTAAAAATTTPTTITTTNNQDQAATDNSAQRGQQDPEDKSRWSARQSMSLSRLRHLSVRRMWNITNQLNILYEANWTSLVLAELVEFEHRFVDTLERLSGLELGQVADQEDQYASERGGGGGDDDDDDDQDGHDERKKSSDKKSHSEANANARQDRERLRLKSIKKSLVHSLATITTMGSPIQPPRSELGRLLTVLYGSIGIPLLLVTVTRSGRQLAHSSLNCLLILRHHCFSLPLHYLCCSCNLFVCLRWLSWCCCCCCCSYLCCLNEGKQKCCDFGEAPKLRLRQRACAKRAKAKGRRSRKVSGGERSLDVPMNEERRQGSSFVIGFNVDHMQQDQLQGGKGDQQKSVRFASSSVGTRGRSSSSTSSGDSGDDSWREADHIPADNQNQEDSSSLLVTSLTILAIYIALGAFYLSDRRQLSWVDSLFACYSMLSTSKLPDSFQLDGHLSETTTSSPLKYYKSHFGSGRHHALANGTSSLAQNKNKHKKQEVRVASRVFGSSEESALLLDAVYLLVGLNLISACAQFAHLWLSKGAPPGGGRKSCPGPPKHSKSEHKPLCNGQAATLLMGSFGQHQASHFGAGPAAPLAPCPPMGPCETQVNQFLVGGPAEQHTSGSPANLTGSQQEDQINLSELFVMGGGGGGHNSGSGGSELSPGAIYQPQQLHQQHQHHSDGASFASSDRSNRSNSAAARSNTRASLCAHHQSTLALQHQAGHNQLHLDPDYTNHLQHHLHHNQSRQHEAYGEQLEGLDSATTLCKMAPSSSAIQLYQPDLDGTAPESTTFSSGMPLSNGCATLTSRRTHQKQPNFGAASTVLVNGFGHHAHYHHSSRHQTEPDSSPNTFDTNSQTISSSMSSRAMAMKPNSMRDQLLEQTPKTVSWFQHDTTTTEDIK